MAKNLSRGISESELVLTIVDELSDARVAWDKISVYIEDGNISNEYRNIFCPLYLLHISKLDVVRHLVEMGRNYFPDAKTDWDFYNPPSDVPTFIEAEKFLTSVKRGHYCGYEVSGHVLGMKWND